MARPLTFTALLALVLVLLVALAPAAHAAEVEETQKDSLRALIANRFRGAMGMGALKKKKKKKKKKSDDSEEDTPDIYCDAGKVSSVSSSGSPILGPPGCSPEQTDEGMMTTDDGETYVRLCGTRCTYKDNLSVDMEVLGSDCAGNKRVDIKVQGVYTDPDGPGDEPTQCIPCTDQKVDVKPEDVVNAGGCHYTDVAMKEVWGAAKSTGKFSSKTWNSATSKKTWNKAGKSLKKGWKKTFG